MPHKVGLQELCRARAIDIDIRGFQVEVIAVVFR